MSIDLFIIALFFLVVFLIGILDRKKVTIDDYWVNSRRTNKWVLVATIASTFLGVGSLLSNAGIAYSGGGLAIIFIMASFFIYFLVFARFFAPKIKEFGDAHNAYTVLDYLEHRYDKKTRVAGLIVNLIAYGLWLALQILGFGIFVSAVGGLDPALATLIGGAIVVAYTTIGGLRADIRTDVFQFLVMLFLILIFLPVVIQENGGLAAITALPQNFLAGGQFAPWYVYILAFIFLGATNLVTSDTWQRAYAGDTPKNVRWAMSVAGIIVFLFLIAGSLFGIYGKIALPADISANNVIPELLKLYLSPALFGLVLAGFFAAIMSSADTILLILSMTLIHDLWQKTLGKPIAPEKLLTVSRWTTLILGALAVAIAVIVFNVIHLAIEAVSFVAALLPAVVFGFYWKKATAAAAFWSIILGFLTILGFSFVDPVQAFIPGMIVAFFAFFVINYLVNRSRYGTTS